jgi:two-component system response regulator AtoC
MRSSTIIPVGPGETRADSQEVSEEQFVVLVASPEAGYRELLLPLLLREGWSFSWAETADEALRQFERIEPSLVLLSTDLEGTEALRLLSRMKEESTRRHVIVIAQNPDIDMAVEVTRLGGDEYLCLESQLDLLHRRLEEAYQHWQQSARGNGDGAWNQRRYGLENIVGESEAMEEVYKWAERIIASDSVTVLIRGETGTGKELLARAMHYGSARGKQPFVEINSTAIPDDLLEAELFGYEKGAFTDAKRQKKGLLELANGGSLFFDEIGHMSMKLQLKLLKVVEEKIFRRVGGVKDISVDVRIMAATSRDLEAALRDGYFREDLFYRLNVVSIEMPPLRERGEDIILLADHFVERFNREYNRQIMQISEDARQLLTAYDWPGNVRELKNTIERAVLLGNGTVIVPEDIRISHRVDTALQDKSHMQKESGITLCLPLEAFSFAEVEKAVIARVLRMNAWNKSKTARMLDISRPRLLRKIRAYGLEKDSSGAGDGTWDEAV